MPTPRACKSIAFDKRRPSEVRYAGTRRADMGAFDGGLCQAPSLLSGIRTSLSPSWCEVTVTIPRPCGVSQRVQTRTLKRS